jgi:hypothetical protein
MKVKELIARLQAGIDNGDIDADADICTVAANHTNHSVYHSPCRIKQIDSMRERNKKVLLIGDIMSMTELGNL